MQVKETSKASQEKETIEVFTRRWYLLVATCACTILNQFLSKSFGAANEIMSAYFDVSLTELDWASVGLYVGTTLITPVFAYLCYVKLIGFRAMSICGCGCLLLSSMCILLAVQFPVLFPLMIAATLLQGVSFCVTFSVGSFFAVLWFPDHQVGLAIAFNAASMALGGILGSCVPPALLKPFPVPANHINTSMLLANESNSDRVWNTSAHATLMSIYSTVAAVLSFLLVFFFIFASDSPPKAPTLALAQKRVSETNFDGAKSLKSFLNNTRALFQDKTYAMCIVIAGVTLHLIVVEMLHLSQIVGNVVAVNDESNISVSLTSGFVMSTFAASAFASSFISAKLLLVFQRYSGQVRVGTGMMLASCIELLMSSYCKSLIGLFVGNILFGLAARICTIPLFEIVTRHTYPKDEALVTVWMAGIGTAILVLISAPARFIASKTSPASALIFMSGIMLVTFVLSFFLKPKNNRGEVDQKLAKASSDNTNDTVLFVPSANECVQYGIDAKQNESKLLPDDDVVVRTRWHFENFAKEATTPNG